ncbi:MAG: phage tail tape measure protein [Methylobacterium sp.]|nr:phage tail tape measure protein [Methylobacterium sp.]MCA4923970.1 phage tail tape measure protein [Methylobacterium sp.]
MATVVRAEAKITAQNALRPGINSAISDLRRFKQASEQLGKARAFEERMAGIGNAMKAAAAGFAAYQVVEQARRALTDFARLDRDMTRIGITGDNASPEEIAKGLSEMRRLAVETAMPINKLKDGMEALTASGESFQRSMEMLPSITRTAQASGAATSDIANTTQAITRHLGIQIRDLEAAQDMITRGGELGQFELKDMARYLPSMAPAARAVGMEGRRGLAQLVAMLQVVREGTGTAEEAAASVRNVFLKMESEETAGKFKKMGVDLRKEMAAARKNGENLIDAFVRLSEKALKGDMSKLPQLFADQEFARGMTALLNGYGKLPGLIEKINNSQGAVANNLKKITSDTQATLDRLSESGDRARQAAGALLADLASPGLANAADNLQSMATSMERMRAAAKDGGILGAIGQGVKDYRQALDRDLAKRRDVFQRDADETTLADMPGRLALANQHAGRHIRVNQDAIRKLEAMPQSADRDQKLATLRRNLAGWQQSAGATPEELAALSRQIGRAGGPVATGIMDPERVELWREMSREANRARGRMSPASATGLPTPPTRQNRVDFRGSPVAPLDEAFTKAEAIKTTFEEAATAAKAPGAAFAASAKTGVDQAIAELERWNAAVRNTAIPGIGRGFPTGRSMSEVE